MGTNKLTCVNTVFEASFASSHQTILECPFMHAHCKGVIPYTYIVYMIDKINIPSLFHAYYNMKRITSHFHQTERPLHLLGVLNKLCKYRHRQQSDTIYGMENFEHLMLSLFANDFDKKLLYCLSLPSEFQFGSQFAFTTAYLGSQQYAK